MSTGLHLSESKQAEFNGLAELLMEWLRKNCHPHATVIVNSEVAELVEGAICSRRVPTHSGN